MGGDESRKSATEATTSGDHSPAAGASHSGTGDINVDQSVHYSSSTQLTYKGERPLGKSLRELVGYFETHTSIQAERLVQPFIGKPLRVEGEVVNIMRFGDTVTAHLRNNDASMILGSFEQSWADRLAEPNLGDDLALIGRIAEISSSSLSLRECELVVE